MKKEIMNLVNTENETVTLKISNVCYLERFKGENSWGIDCDRLVIVFNNLNGLCYQVHEKRIKSRDFKGICEEVEKAIEDFFEEVKRRNVSNFKCGYFG